MKEVQHRELDAEEIPKLKAIIQSSAQFTEVSDKEMRTVNNGGKLVFIFEKMNQVKTMLIYKSGYLYLSKEAIYGREKARHFIDKDWEWIAKSLVWWISPRSGGADRGVFT